MRPLELQVEGFTSFRDRQNIPFRDFDLFVITGPTGAGKTSVLDAIAFALYGSVPRMGKQGLGELVTHGCAEARVMLDFSVNGQSYRLARRLPRHGAQSARLERDAGGEWVDAVEGSGVRAVNQAVLDLVKLDFEGFCKAVLLPQGAFADFLSGDRAERRGTLVDLLGLSHFFRMREIASSRAGELGTKDEQTEKILVEHFEDATAEAVAEARSVAKAAREHASSLHELETQAREVDRERSAAGARAEGLTSLGRSAADLHDELVSGVDDCRKAQEEADAAVKEKRSKLEAVSRANASLTKAREDREQVVKRVGTHEELAAAAVAVDQLGGLTEGVRKAEEAVKDASARAIKLKQEATQAERAFQAARKRMATARTAADEKTQVHAMLAKGEEELRRRLDVARQEQAAVRDAEKKLEAAGEQLSKAEEAVKKAHAQRDRVRAKFETARRNNAVVELAGALAVGDPCPVCERTLTETPQVDAHAEKHLEERTAEVAGADDDVERTFQERSAASGEVTSLEGLVEDARGRLSKVLGQHADVDALTAAVDQATTPTADALAAADAARAALAEAEEHERAAELAQGDAGKNVEAHDEKAGLLAASLEEAEQARDRALAVLHNRFGQQIPADASKRVAGDRDSLAAAEERSDAAYAHAAAAKDELDQAQEGLRAAEGRVGEVDVSLGKSRERAESLIRELEQMASGVALRALPKEAKARDSRSQGLAKWCEVATGRLDHAAEKACAAEIAAAERIARLASENELGSPEPADVLGVIEQARVAVGEESVRADTAAQQLKAQLKQRKALEAELEENKEQRSVLEALATELRANRFVDFVISETLELLAMRASEELLRVSAGRYSLVTEDGQFNVVDRTNADERRSVRTLSGGETFLASLSLALALSKHVTELAGEGLGTRLETVFIDEGFGTLDAETLDEVIDALERVRGEDVLVGVISHVSELSERIRSGLEVRKDGNKSVVVAS